VTGHQQQHELEQEQEPWFWGTVEYVAPEIIEKGLAGYAFASDWW
jgi:serine/threonine protein kinase